MLVQKLNQIQDRSSRVLYKMFAATEHGSRARFNQMYGNIRYSGERVLKKGSGLGRAFWQLSF